MTTIVGIDPGLSGAMVALDSIGDSWEPSAWIRMPVEDSVDYRGIDASNMYQWLRARNPKAIYLERVHTMPKQGVASSGTFMGAFHAARAVARLVRPVRLITPQVWKRHLNLIGRPKDASRMLAMSLWADWSELGRKAAGQAYADAAFIALAGFAKYGSN